MYLEHGVVAPNGANADSVRGMEGIRWNGRRRMKLLNTKNQPNNQNTKTTRRNEML